MNNLLNVIQDWYVSIKIFVNTEVSQLAFIVIIAFLAIAILTLMRYIVKYGFNVNVIKRNIILPTVLTVILTAILILLCTMRYV